MPPKGRGALSPFAKLAENTAARAETPPSSPAGSRPRARAAGGSQSPVPAGTVSHDHFQLPRALESTTHRRLRAVLQEVLRAATAWEEEHTLEGIRWATEAKGAWEQVSAAALAGDGRRAELISALQTIDTASEQLHGMLARIARHTQKLHTACDAGSALLAEVGERHPEMAFVEPMWATWTLERFIVAAHSLSMQYSVSAAHLGVVVRELAGQQDGARAGDLDAAAARKRDALAEFVRLPYLHPSGVSGAAPTFSADADSECGVSRHFFEHVCEAEVRGW